MTRQHIVFLTDAGISAESGLSTFRGKDGLWTKEEFRYYASTDCLYSEPEKCLDFYNMRRKKLSEVEPNEAHRLIAELEKEHEGTVTTQNVDNLHERAGSTKVIHLHGEMTKVCSSENRSQLIVMNLDVRQVYPKTTHVELPLTVTTLDVRMARQKQREMEPPIVITCEENKEVQQQEDNTLMNPNESGRCPYCGSEDIEEYYDSTAECHECGARWYWSCTY